MNLGLRIFSIQSLSLTPSSTSLSFFFFFIFHFQDFLFYLMLFLIQTSVFKQGKNRGELRSMAKTSPSNSWIGNPLSRFFPTHLFLWAFSLLSVLYSHLSGCLLPFSFFSLETRASLTLNLSPHVVSLQGIHLLSN